MAIDPKLVSIKTAAQLPSGIPTASGEFLYFEDETLKKAEMSDLYDRLESAYLGIITPSSTIPATGSWYGTVLAAGTFNNVTPAITVDAADFDIENGTPNNEVRIIITEGVPTKRVERVKGDTGAAGRGIVSRVKTGTVGEVDTYTITYTDGTTSTETVTNGTNSKLPIYNPANSYAAESQLIYENTIYRVKTGQTLNVGELPANFVGVKVERVSGGIDQIGVFTYSTGPTKDVDNIANYTLAFDFDGNTTVKAGSVSATVTGTPTYGNDRNNIASSALDFSTSGLKVVAPNYLNPTTKRVSISFWMKTTQTNLGIICEQHVSSVAGLVNYWSVFINEAASSGKLTISSNYGGTLNSYRTGKVVNDGAWHHVVALIDRNQPGTMEISVYIDGVKDVGGNYALSFDLNNDFMNRDIYFGARNISTYPFVGSFDQFRFYPRILKQSEINLLYNEN